MHFNQHKLYKQEVLIILSQDHRAMEEEEVCQILEEDIRAIRIPDNKIQIINHNNNNNNKTKIFRIQETIFDLEDLKVEVEVAMMVDNHKIQVTFKEEEVAMTAVNKMEEALEEEVEVEAEVVMKEGYLIKALLVGNFKITSSQRKCMLIIL